MKHIDQKGGISLMKVAIAQCFIIVGALSTLTGCATQSLPYVIDVDSINSGVMGKNKYVLLSAVEGVSENDLQFKEFAKYTNYALKKKGFSKVEEASDADVAIFLFYDLSEPTEHTYSYSVPIVGQTGVSSTYTTGTASSYGNMTTYSGSTTGTPTYGVVGASQGSGTYTYYTRYISLEAIDMKESQRSGEKEQVWKTTMISEGASGDLRKMFPILVAAGQKYFGENTGRKVEITLYDGDVRIVDIKSALNPSSPSEVDGQQQSIAP